jgi:putative glutamine amidotransferase
VKTSLVFLILSLFCQSIALAKIRLVEWHTKSTLAPLIIPVRDSETPEEASRRYLKNLSQNPGLMELFQGQVPQMETLRFQELNSKEHESRTLLMANLPKDTTRNSVRVEKFKFYLQKNQQKSFILPINANLGLSASETRELFAEISEKFPMLVVMGGEDVAPALYNKENFHAGNTTPERDVFEIALIKSYVTSAKGFLLGVCRGSQITSVAMGYELLQDIPFHLKENVGHSHTWHDIRLMPTENLILKNILPESNVWNVNSEHHQMAKITGKGPLQVSAHAEDGVIEASEFKNGRGLLLQFHPELMENNIGFRIITGAVKAKNRVMPRLCSRIFLN